MTHKLPFLFRENATLKAEKGTFIATIQKGLKDKDSLLAALAIALNFPAYFGNNWDALFDCLRDFHWMDEPNIVIVHDDLPNLPPTEIRIYLGVLRDAVQDWKPDETGSLQVVFNERDRATIERTLSGQR
jgi:RNAse (barnase) inhibitor barstar